MVTTVDGIVYEVYEELLSAMVIDYIPEELSTNVVIPESIFLDGKHYFVKSIDKFAFASAKIESVQLPKNLLVIYESAFECSALKRVVSSEKTEASDELCIERQAFAHCRKLETVQIHHKMHLNDDYIFLNCENLKTFSSQNIIGTIPRRTFENCGSLKKFWIPDDITVHPNAFTGTNFQKVFIGKNVKLLGDITQELKTESVGCFADSDAKDLAFAGFKVDILCE